MDPTACWKEIVECLREDNVIDAEEKINDLMNWLNRGGAMPTIEPRELVTLLSWIDLY